MKKQRAENSRGRKLLPRYEDKLMGLPVVLLNAAYEDSHGDETGVIVPDINALESAIALARTTVAHKLSGKEIRYLRKAIGQKANELAKFLDMTPEHYSRLESSGTLTTNAERIFRLRVVHTLRNKARGVIVKDDDILNMHFLPFRSSLEPTTLIFDRLFVLDEVPQEVWHFVGVDKIEETTRVLRVVA